MWITCWHCDVVTPDGGNPTKSDANSAPQTHLPTLGAVSCARGFKSRARGVVASSFPVEASRDDHGEA